MSETPTRSRQSARLWVGRLKGCGVSALLQPRFFLVLNPENTLCRDGVSN